MTIFDDIEARLMDLSMAGEQSDTHLDDEAMAEIIEGREPTEAEAEHLNRCESSRECLILIAEGLESFRAMDQVDVAESTVMSLKLAQPLPRRANVPLVFAAVAVFHLPRSALLVLSSWFVVLVR